MVRTAVGSGGTVGAVGAAHAVAAVAAAGGPAGDSVADRLDRARRVLHRMEGRSDAERSRPEPGTDAASLPVPAPLAGLLPGGGLRRGSTVAVATGPAAGSLLFALLAAASAEGSWAGIVGRPGLGTTAAAEAGVRLDRLALVPDPGADLVPVTAALLDGLDLVVVAGAERAGLRGADRQRLAARARQRGAVLLALGSWPGADVRLRCSRVSWDGPDSGAGRLRARRVEVHAHGRGTGPAGRSAEMLLPGPGGAVAALRAPAAPGVVPSRGAAAAARHGGPGTVPEPLREAPDPLRAASTEAGRSVRVAG